MQIRQANQAAAADGRICFNFIFCSGKPEINIPNDPVDENTNGQKLTLARV